MKMAVDKNFVLWLIRNLLRRKLPESTQKSQSSFKLSSKSFRNMRIRLPILLTKEFIASTTNVRKHNKVMFGGDSLIGFVWLSTCAPSPITVYITFFILISI